MIYSPIPGIIRCTQKFALNPQIYAQFGLKGHNGIDLTGQQAGELVAMYAPFEGVIYRCRDEGPKKGYGKYIVLRSESLDRDGRYKELVLAHMTDQAVKEGQRVYQGEYLGRMGNTGFSFGAHVHMGLRFLDKNKKVLNHNNGYKGYIDFLPHLIPWPAPWMDQKEAYIVYV